MKDKNGMALCLKVVRREVVAVGHRIVSIKQFLDACGRSLMAQESGLFFDGNSSCLVVLI